MTATSEKLQAIRDSYGMDFPSGVLAGLSGGELEELTTLETEHPDPTRLSFLQTLWREKQARARALVHPEGQGV